MGKEGQAQEEMREEKRVLETGRERKRQLEGEREAEIDTQKNKRAWEIKTEVDKDRKAQPHRGTNMTCMRSYRKEGNDR